MVKQEYIVKNDKLYLIKDDEEFECSQEELTEIIVKQDKNRTELSDDYLDKMKDMFNELMLPLLNNSVDMRYEVAKAAMQGILSHSSVNYGANAHNEQLPEICFKIADNFNKKRPHIKVSSFMSEILWRLYFLKSKITGKAPLMTKKSARSSHLKSYYSSKKIETALSYKFESIDKKIQNICKDYLK